MKYSTMIIHRVLQSHISNAVISVANSCHSLTAKESRFKKSLPAPAEKRTVFCLSHLHTHKQEAQQHKGT